MQLGMIGLGRMGANMVRRLLKGGHECVAYDVSAKAVADLVSEKAVMAMAPARAEPLLAASTRPPQRAPQGMNTLSPPSKAGRAGNLRKSFSSQEAWGVF